MMLTCSCCPKHADFDPPPTLPGLIGARYIARRVGWRTRPVREGGADLCPKCSKRVLRPVTKETPEQLAKREEREAAAERAKVLPPKQTEAERKEAARFRVRQARRSEFKGVAEVLGWAR